MKVKLGHVSYAVRLKRHTNTDSLEKVYLRKCIGGNDSQARFNELNK